MKNISLEELKKIQISILDYVVDYCNKNKIKYWLDCGTLLGAIRHKGYIPWDDDIDIGMLRKDYEKFVLFFNNNIKRDRYQVRCIENDKSIFVAFAKVFDLTTVLYEPDENGFKSCVNIDIFVYDNAPDDESLLKKQFRKRCLYQKLFHTQAIRPKIKSIKSILLFFLHYILIVFPKGFFIQCVSKNAKKYNIIETKCVGNFSALDIVVCNKRVFDDFINVEFEGKKYLAPIGYQEWLTAFYGDYMKLPPKDKRVSHHHFIAHYL